MQKQIQTSDWKKIFASISIERKKNAIEERKTKLKQALILSSILAFSYGVVWIGTWPGLLGQDSIGILLEILNPTERSSGKTGTWFYLVNAFYAQHQHVEYYIAFQIAITIAILARILAWTWNNSSKLAFYFSFFSIALNFQLVRHSITLYPDALFSIAAIGLIFECYLVNRRKSVTWASFLIISITIPLACDLRSNGIIFTAIPLVSIFLLPQKKRSLLIAATAIGFALLIISKTSYKGHSQEAMTPLVLWETANFLQTRPHPSWPTQPRISEKTIEIIEKNSSIKSINEFYDRNYWDTLVFPEDGPKLMNIPKEERKQLVSEFWRYNIWENLAPFISSRVNVFFASAFSDNTGIGTNYRHQVLKIVESHSKTLNEKFPELTKNVEKVNQWSERNRIWYWSPLIGISLIFLIFYSSIKNNYFFGTFVSFIMAIQLLGIFIMSIAAEHRYLLPFFAFPLAALPIWIDAKKSTGQLS